VAGIVSSCAAVVAVKTKYFIDRSVQRAPRPATRQHVLYFIGCRSVLLFLEQIITGKLLFFGVDLLFDESDESFFWLFSNFLKAMSGKHPETIFTDQCAAMAKAIEIALPNSCHRFAYGTYTKML
jgi:hypothetical protein